MILLEIIKVIYHIYIKIKLISIEYINDKPFHQFKLIEPIQISKEASEELIIRDNDYIILINDCIYSKYQIDDDLNKIKQFIKKSNNPQIKINNINVFYYVLIFQTMYIQNLRKMNIY